MNETLLKAWTEADLQAFVKATAEAVGAYHYHTRDSRKSKAGYPDSTVILEPRVIFAELKKVGKMPTDGQLRVLSRLERCPGVEVYLWDPMDWREVEEVLGVSKGRYVAPLMQVGLFCERCGDQFNCYSRRTRACSAVCKAALWRDERKRGKG